jgi:hypothetical protein
MSVFSQIDLELKEARIDELKGYLSGDCQDDGSLLYRFKDNEQIRAYIKEAISMYDYDREEDNY